METPTTPTKRPLIRLIYLYLVALIGLVVFLMGGVGIVNTGLKAALGVNDSYFTSPNEMCRAQFTVATSAPTVTAKLPDENSTDFKQCLVNQEQQQNDQQKNDRKRNIAEALAQIILGAPIWLYHWSVIQRDHKDQTA